MRRPKPRYLGHLAICLVVSFANPAPKDQEQDFRPVVTDVATSIDIEGHISNVHWSLSSEINGRTSHTRDADFTYRYIFSNLGEVAIKITLVSPHLAMSPLFDILQDFSLVLLPRQVKKVEFS